MRFFKKPDAKLLVVGLGNPGQGYKNTRHNIGFEVVDRLCDELCVKMSHQKFNAIYTKLKSGSKTVILLKPQTFMNNSGVAVAQFAQYYKVNPESIVVIHDDITLPFGQFKIKQGGSSGGHNGVQSVIDFLNSEGFIRLKLGVGGKPHKEMNLADWVLKRFDEEELKIARSLAKGAAEAVCEIVSGGAGAAMNKYNTKNTEKLG